MEFLIVSNPLPDVKHMLLLHLDVFCFHVTLSFENQLSISEVVRCSVICIGLFVTQSVDQSFAIELVIGFIQNTKTVVRHIFSGEIINITDSLNVLSCLEFRTFWVSWHDGWLRCGHGFSYSNHILIEARVSFLISIVCNYNESTRRNEGQRV